MKQYSSDELAQSDGKEGRTTLIAVDGNVYDVSKSKKWVDGVHMKRHHAGKDLTSDIEAAPHGKEVLERFEVAGKHQKTAQATSSGAAGGLDAWLDQHPFFRRHPHPAIVHIPLGMFSVAPLFLIIAILWKSGRTEWAAFCCTLIGLAAMPLAIASGYFTWWINYEMVDSTIIRKKRGLAWTALVVAIASVALRSWVVSNATEIGDPWAVLNLILLIVLGIMFVMIGNLGGRLTFPYE
jgi:predicted heme/steroid binding protein/uncharacterized membrane protein